MIPLLGLLPELTANGLARLSMPFFRLGSFEGASYFSLESLKGAMISILIGILVYFLIVRTCTMRKKARAARTSTRTPPGLIWSGTCTVRCCGSSQRWAACWRGSRIPLTDALLALLRATFYRDITRKLPPEYGNRVTYTLGSAMDRVADSYCAITHKNAAASRTFTG